MNNCCDDRTIFTTSSTEALRYLIFENFDEGDIIGLTFIVQGVASIITGTFVKVVGGVVIVNDLLQDDTTSYVPLTVLSSVEKGITEATTSDKPISIPLVN